MGFFDDITGATGAKAANQAANAQVQAAKRQKKQANRYEQAALGDINRTTGQATSAISAGEAEALRYRERAGEQLTASEQQALAQYNASEGQALGRLDAGQASALGEINVGQEGALGAVGQGRDQSINALLRGPNSALGSIDSATESALGYFEPYATAGAKAMDEVAALQGLYGPDAQEQARSRFQTDPGYQFRVSEAMGALDRSATARGGLYSGAAMKALQDRASDLASQEYGNYYGRTAGIASQGADIAGQRAGIQTQAGQNRANIYGRASDVYGQTAGQEADIYTNAGANRANIYQGMAGAAADVYGHGGAARSDIITQGGANRANVLAGSGDVVMQSRANQANTLMGGAGMRTGVRGTALDARTNALAGIGNARAAGYVGAANARMAGSNNLLATGTTLATAAMGMPSGGGGRNIPVSGGAPYSGNPYNLPWLA